MCCPTCPDVKHFILVYITEKDAWANLLLLNWQLPGLIFNLSLLSKC